MKKQPRIQLAGIIYWSVIGVLFYIMNYFTPLRIDDFDNYLIYRNTPPLSVYELIISIIKSTWQNYLTMTGRIVPHVCVHLFVGYFGKSVFNVANAIVFVVFLRLLALNLRASVGSCYTSVTLALFLLVLFSPFGVCFLWMSGTFNYLWPITFLLGFNLLLRREIDWHRWWPALFLYGIVCGATNEAFVVGFAVAYLIYFGRHYRDLSLSRVALLSGFYVGAALLLLSPGNIHRATEGGIVTFDVGVFVHNMLSSLLQMSNVRVLPILLLALVVFMMVDRKRAKAFVSAHGHWLMAIVVSFLFVVWTKHSSYYSRFGFEFLSMLLLVMVLGQLNFSKWVLHAINAATMICLCCAISVQANNYREFQNCWAQLSQPETSLVLTNEKTVSPFFQRMTVSFTVANKTGNLMSDGWIATYFHKDHLQFLPESFYRDVVAHPDRFEQVDVHTSYPFYCMAAPTDSITKVTYRLAPTDYGDLPFYIRPFATKMERYSATAIDTDRYDIVQIGGVRYLLVAKQPMLQDRVCDIRVE